MELTNELLLNNGFKVNNPKTVLATFYLNSTTQPKWGIVVSKQYLPYSNKLSYNCDCWLCNDKGVIIKKSSLTNVNTKEDLNSIIKLCNIDYQL